jgi:hypothetical protein
MREEGPKACEEAGPTPGRGVRGKCSAGKEKNTRQQSFGRWGGDEDRRAAPIDRQIPETRGDDVQSSFSRRTEAGVETAVRKPQQEETKDGHQNGLRISILSTMNKGTYPEEGGWGIIGCWKQQLDMINKSTLMDPRGKGKGV